jgi:glycerophosphoryl diester phosphodiesterase
MSAMTEPLKVSAPAGAAWRDFRRAWRSLVIFEVVFKFAEAWLFVPALAVGLSAVLSRAGHVAVSNRDVLDFLITPSGLLYAALVGVAGAAVLLLEQAGIMVLVARAGVGEPTPVARALFAVPLGVVRVARLGAVKVVLLALTILPFVLLALLSYGVLLSRHDINFYLAERPPRFWFAAAAGVLIALAALAVGVVLFVRWAFALPILLFESQSARGALRASRERVRGVGWRIGGILVGWQVGVFLLGLGLQTGFRACAAALLEHTGDRVSILVVLLIGQGALLAAVSFVAVVGHALLARRLYLARSEQLGVIRPQAPAAWAPAPPGTRRLVYPALAAVLVTPVVAWVGLVPNLDSRPPVQVTAHRGHSRAAPENTLGAVRKAIESGADYAEVDVQLTSDGVAVLLHDRDLKRVTGDARRIDEVTYEEVRKLDAGGWFGPAFAGERVPTLAEVIDLARGRIKLNIELKLYGPDVRLAREVARVVCDGGFTADCLVTSFSLDALQEVRRYDPRLRTGLIVATALGDVTRMEGDALSVRADWLSDDVLRAAHRRGLEVHVWTVKDERQMARLIKRGVDNIITDDPDLLVRVRGEWARRTGAGRLVLASRVLLGLDP